MATLLLYQEPDTALGLSGLRRWNWKFEETGTAGVHWAEGRREKHTDREFQAWTDSTERDLLMFEQITRGEVQRAS
jgi:hypothetical protein